MTNDIFVVKLWSIMKGRVFLIISFVVVYLISLANLILCVRMYITRPLSAGDIFYANSLSVLEVKGESEEIGTSYGTGEIISKEGLIVTNAHVITYKNLKETYVFDSISVRFVDETDFREVSIEKYDLELDIAVLRLTNVDRDIQVMDVGDDSALKTGDSVYAIGNMSNHGISLTSGYIALPHIDVTYNGTTRNVIQCDLTIADGNSGGALLDKNGRLIGITTFRLKDGSNNVIYGISYCITINAVMEYIESNT